MTDRRVTAAAKVRLKRTLAAVVAVVLTVLFGWTPVAQAAGPSLGLTVMPVTSTVTSGNQMTFQVSWSCNSVSVPCTNGVVTVPVPTLTPDTIVKTTYSSGTASTGGFSSTPTVSGGVITWTLSPSIPSGSSGQMTFTVLVPNHSSPNGDTVNPTATFTVDGASTTASGVATVVSDTDLITDKRIPGNTIPALDAPITYQITTGHKSSISPVSGQFGWEPGKGTWAVENVVTVDTLPAGAVFVSATGGGVFNAATDTVTWPAWSDGATFTAAPSYFLTVTYPSTVFTTASTVTNTAQATANPYLRPNETIKSSLGSVTHGFVAYTASGNIGKYYPFVGAAQSARGTSAEWKIKVGNTGNVPLDMAATDTLPCQFTSPVDGSTNCSTPGVTNISFHVFGQLTTTVTINYTTNLGNTGMVLITPGNTAPPTPVISTTEWITSFSAAATLPGGSGIDLSIYGTTSSTLPAIAPAGTPYQLSSVPTQISPAYLENCMSKATLTDPKTGTVVAGLPGISASSPGRCGYVKVLPNAPHPRLGKIMKNNVQGVGGRIDTQLQLLTLQSNTVWHPIVTDLLPSDLKIVPGSLTVTPNALAPYLPSADLKVEIIDNYNGTGRQLVRITWPGGPGVPPSLGTAYIDFKSEVQPNAPIGQQTNTAMIFDAAQPNYGTDAAPNQCVDTPVGDPDNISGLNDPKALGCADSANYTVIASGAIGGAKWVKGNLDSSYQASPSVGQVTPGNPASYRLDITNTGNVPVNNVVAYDILPYVGDTGVGPAGTDQRGSQWQANLSGPVTTDISGALVSYSLSTNPCRGEVEGTGGSPTASAPAGCVNDWTTTLPADPSTVRAIRIAYGASTFPVAGTHSVTIPVVSSAAADGTAWNSFAVAGYRTDTGAALLPVEPAKVGLQVPIDVSVTKTAPPGPYAPGGTVTWTITVNNKGPGTASSVTLSDPLPRTLSYVSSSTANGSYNPATRVWTLATPLAPGNTATLSLTSTIASGTEGQELCNTADLTGTGNINSSTQTSATACIAVSVTPPPTPTGTPSTTPPPTPTGTPSVTPPPGTPASTPTPGGLAFTGANGLGILLPAAALLVLIGLTLTTAFRRRHGRHT